MSRTFPQANLVASFIIYPISFTKRNAYEIIVITDAGGSLVKGKIREEFP